ncbi:hypothetical protein RVR_8343 [Actinacidiphila reveromycinica]|uniref:Uncharacterized protein n=1 Tax=Actinacidiphila reveromycinica TaxID=659352 RepID=A0A7U3VRR8_9ACTN|nr:RNA polymerase subunit sigma-70 [Streptomyces sp. SN-593]BBB01091.1 hypothetical protein RVR_8343 [Streptomyces sp. SN-593]
MSETYDGTTAIRAVIAQLATIPDLTDRARATGAVLDAMPDLHAELRAVRGDAVATLRQTQSLDEVASALGISKARVSQVAKGISKNK